MPCEGDALCLMQVIGVLLIAAGSWALTQKDSNVSMLGEIFISPVLLLLIAGCIIFVIGFFGCIGALRENAFLLIIVSDNLFLLLLYEWLLNSSHIVVQSLP